MTERHVYTEDGQRLYTTAEYAEALGVTPEAIRLRLHRQRAEPYTRLDGRTPLWTLPVDNETALAHLQVGEGGLATPGPRHLAGVQDSAGHKLRSIVWNAPDLIWRNPPDHRLAARTQLPTATSVTP